MEDEIRENMIIQCIRNYKNKDFTDDEIREKYDLAISYMTDNFERLFQDSMSNSNGISSFSQGNRSISYNNNINSIIEGDKVLIALLGKPFMRCY
ncbi:hypothetical protein [uncultured Clostridium sp.]|uniref:hypothetical protein n=1 Tax=uncultured Clostridium sp. TaxID=59620 RepID=UPI0025EE649A|nr:hypothetical protein [uncultured Clostridium sp.]